MAQWNKLNQDYLNQERSLFEVYMRADKHGNIYEDLGQGFSGDLFGRLKVSSPLTIFDCDHRYDQDGDFDDVVLGAGSTVGIITAQSSAILGIGTTAGCSIIRETKRIFSYQPGKALQILQTFVFNPAKQNLVQRVGYASSENGVMLQLDGTEVSFIKRTAITGVTTTIKVLQSEWNHDTLDGTGPNASNPSGIKLDLSKGQILFSEFEWLGLGCVRVGFANSNGKFHIAHVFNHANMLDTVYMTTACLPLRYEIANIGITTSPSTMKQICASVQSNGGYEKKVAPCTARQTALVSIGSTIFIPLVSIRLKPGREDAIIIPNKINLLPDSSTSVYYEVALVKNATISGGSWVNNNQSTNVQENTAATSMSGGEIIEIEYVSSANKSTSAINEVSEYNWDLQLGRTQAKVSDVYTIACRAIEGSGKAIAALSFYDLT